MATREPVHVPWVGLGDPPPRLFDAPRVSAAVASEVLARHGGDIAACVQTACSDGAFVALCRAAGRGDHAQIALPKAPANATARVLAWLLDGLPRALRGHAAGPDGSALGELPPRGDAVDGLAWAVVPGPVAVAITVSHGLFAALSREADPLTEDPFHADVIAWLLDKARFTPWVGERLVACAERRGLGASAFSSATLGELRWRGALPGAARDALGALATRVATEPWTKALADALASASLPALGALLDGGGPARDDGAAVCLRVSVAPLLPWRVALAALAGLGASQPLLDARAAWLKEEPPGSALLFGVTPA